MNLRILKWQLVTVAGSGIKLEYFDQFGNKLNSKEAYKELSRKFHGKAAGKGGLERMKMKRENSLKLESGTATGRIRCSLHDSIQNCKSGKKSKIIGFQMK